MIERINIEEREDRELQSYATKSRNSRGRKYDEEKCSLRTEFQRDRDRIIHSKAFRRLMHKTQVFITADGDHFRTRLTHTIEVAQISRTAARSLGLNEDLVEAIALGHDLGHTPFGHTGERMLNEIHDGGFKHNVQSLRVVDVLEEGHGYRGMNLTEEVRDGILNHTGRTLPFTPEGQIVKICDRIAYINHDIDDAIRGGILKGEDIPEECKEFLGDTHRKRIHSMVFDLVEHSYGKRTVAQSKKGAGILTMLRKFMFEKVYHNEEVKRKEDISMAEESIKFLYDYYRKNPECLPKQMFDMIGEFGTDVIVKDFIAGMTDRYAVEKYSSFLK